MMTLSRLEGYARALVPFGSAFIAVLIDMLPVPGAAGGGLGPAFTLGVVFFWSVYRPDLMTAPAVFLIGLIHDALAGLPPGLSSLALLVGRTGLVYRQRFFHAKSFEVIWACFLVLASAVECLRFAIASIWFGMVADPRPVLFQCALTVALYPPLGWLLVRLHDQMVTGEHAEP